MDYVKHYDKLIQRAKSRILGGYVERHHITPKCIGGTDEADNICQLTADEHYFAHLLLIKIYPEHDSLVFALHKMGSSSKKTSGRSRRKQYGWIRRRHAEAASRRSEGSKNSQFGTKWITDGVCNAKIMGDQPIPHGWKYGRSKVLSESGKRNISKIQRNNRLGKPRTEITKQKIREAAKRRYRKLNQ